MNRSMISFSVAMLITMTALGASPGPASVSGWKAGTHYKEIMPPRPTRAAAGKIEVIELFWYGCDHCNELETPLTKWLARKPEYVQFTRVPVPWNSESRAHARLFYTLQALQRNDLHGKIFETIFVQGNSLVGANEEDTLAKQTGFAKAHGIAPKEFREMYQSSLVDGYIQRALDVVRSYKIAGVPSIVVNGRYISDDDLAGGKSNLVELTKYLAASEWEKAGAQTRSAALVH